MSDDAKKLSERDFEQNNSNAAVKPVEEEDLLDKRHLRWMRWVVFCVIMGWSIVSFGLYILFGDNGLDDLISLSPYCIFIVVLLVVIPALMLSYLTCSVFRTQSRINENSIASLFTRLVRIWKTTH